MVEDDVAIKMWLFSVTFFDYRSIKLDRTELLSLRILEHVILAKYKVSCAKEVAKSY